MTTLRPTARSCCRSSARLPIRRSTGGTSATCTARACTRGTRSPPGKRRALPSSPSPPTGSRGCCARSGSAMGFDAAPAHGGNGGARSTQAEPLDILFVTSDKFPPFRPAAKAIFADGLAERGYRIDWITSAADASSPSGAQPFKGGTAYIAPTDMGETRFARVRKHWAQLRNDFRVFALVRAHRYALVQIKDKYLGALLAILAAKLHRVPVFYWLAYPHGEASLYAARNGVARYSWFYALRGRLQQWLLYKIILPSCDHVFVQSEQMLRDVADRGIAPTKMTAVPSSVNLAEIDAAVAAGGIATRPRTIAYLGTLLRERRLDVLIGALAQVREQIPEAELMFVGA